MSGGGGGEKKIQVRASACAYHNSQSCELRLDSWPKGLMAGRMKLRPRPPLHFSEDGNSCVSAKSAHEKPADL